MASIVKRRPCGECPWRLDAPAGKFLPERYEQLRATAGSPGAEVPMGAPFFACHMTEEGSDMVCAGWAAVCGVEHLGLRLAAVTGRVHQGAFAPAAGWPALYGSYDELQAANTLGGAR